MTTVAMKWNNLSWILVYCPPCLVSTFTSCCPEALTVERGPRVNPGLKLVNLVTSSKFCVTFLPHKMEVIIIYFTWNTYKNCNRENGIWPRLYIFLYVLPINERVHVIVKGKDLDQSMKLSTLIGKQSRLCVWASCRNGRTAWPLWGNWDKVH